MKEFLEYNIIDVGNYHLSILSFGEVIAIIILTRLILWLINLFLLRGFFKRKIRIDQGRQFAIRQIIKYTLYFIAATLILQSVGVKLSVLWGASAALLVGIGFGVQQAFSDLMSGIILLIEGSVEVGDVMKIEGEVGRVTKIGLRTCTVRTRNETSLVIPNSKLVMNPVSNWSHMGSHSRFEVRVGVAYGSDVQLVKEVLLEVAKNHVSVINNPEPRVQFTDFGESALHFRLLFFSRDRMPIEFVKSDLRFEIDRQFKAKDIKIPFPQRDLWIREIPGKT